MSENQGVTPVPSSGFDRQRTPLDCGRTALAAIARTHGVDCLALDAIDANVPMSLFEICESAERLGLVAEGVRLRPPRLHHLAERLPCMLLCYSTSPSPSTPFHYLVLTSIADDAAVIFDPNHGVYAVTTQRLTNAWTGIAVLFSILDRSPRPVPRRRHDRQR